MPGLYEVDRPGLVRLLEDEPPYRVHQVWEGLYHQGRLPGEMTNLPVALRERLTAAFEPSLFPAARQEGDAGQTVKWSWRLGDGAAIETVMMAYPDRVTVCVSTQAGCAMACRFCATGQSGYRRQLTTGEIIEQVMAAMREARPRRVSHVVFMGMGEPLANYDHVLAAVRRLHDDVGLSARRLTISTVGIVPGIRRLAAEALPVTLAVSLHAANDELRDQLVPVNRRYPLADLAASCRKYREATGRRLSLEWALIDEVNDRPIDAAQLAHFAAPLGAHVNLIPLNPTPGYLVRGTPPDRVAGFHDDLSCRGIATTIRATRGADIDAACGQLAVPAPLSAAAIALSPPATP